MTKIIRAPRPTKRLIKSPVKPRIVKPQPARFSAPCIHRGAVLGKLDCLCKGKPEVFTCALHGRCITHQVPAKGTFVLALLDKTTEQVTEAQRPDVCDTCPDRSEGVAPAPILVPVGPQPKPIEPSLDDRLAAVLSGHGPGSELWRLLGSLGIEHQADCECLAWAERMNAWGPDGCQQHRAEIVHHMRQSAEQYGWGAVAKVITKSLTTGIAWRLNPLDPYGSLVDEAIRRARRAAPPKHVRPPHPHDRPLSVEDLEWISTSQLVEDGLRLVRYVDPDMTGIIGVPRSGMIPAAAVAAHVHLPLYELTPHGPRQLATGSRGHNWGVLPTRPRYLLIDDSSHNGGSMQRARSVLRGHNVVYSAVYTLTPQTVDVYARLLDKVHVFDWNIFNNGLLDGRAIDPRLRGEGFMFDFDGILCPDTPFPHADADEQRVRSWLRDVRPLRWIPRYATLPYVVSFRLERHRDIIQAWLDKWRIRVRHLILHLAQSFAERDAHFDAVSHKAERFRQSRCTLFVESCPKQSALIARHSGKPVLCPTSRKFFFP